MLLGCGPSTSARADVLTNHDSTALMPHAQSKLALEWRQWMTERLTAEYFEDRTFYRVQAGGLLDNPDQRIASDIRQADSIFGPALPQYCRCAPVTPLLWPRECLICQLPA